MHTRARAGQAGGESHSATIGGFPHPVTKAVTALVVVYVVLWGFEGGIRKWIPGTDAIFYVLRDAILFAALVCAHLLSSSRHRSVPWFWVGALVLGVMTAIDIIGDLTGITTGVIGLRGYLAPLLLLAFVMVYPVEGLAERITTTVCVIALVNLPLTILQVMSPPASFVNKEISSDAASFVNPGNIVRPSGTFSAPDGHTLLQSLALAIALGALYSGRVPRWVAVSTIGATIVMTTLSGSRGALVSGATVLVVFLYAQLARGSFRSALTLVGMSAAIGALYLVIAATLPTVVASFVQRINDAAGSEDFQSRILNTAFGFFNVPFDISGAGVGARGNAALQLGTTTSWAETDLARTVVELGLLGIAAATVRLVIGIITVCAMVVLPRRLPLELLLLLGVAAPLLLGGNIIQTPASQGAFSILSALIYLVLPNRHARQGVGASTPLSSAAGPATRVRVTMQKRKRSHDSFPFASDDSGSQSAAQL